MQKQAKEMLMEHKDMSKFQWKQKERQDSFFHVIVGQELNEEISSDTGFIGLTGQKFKVEVYP